MSWKALSETPPKELAEFTSYRRRAKRTRFLVDENLGPGVADLLRSWRYRATYAEEVGLNHKDDKDLAAWAWRNDHVLLTHDPDFLNDRRVPENRNPGIIVLPGASGHEDSLDEALYWTCVLFGKDPERYKGMKAHFTQGNCCKIKERDITTGAVQERSLRLTPQGVQEWED
jgi:uncharacterized protein with PIN domain